MSYLVINLKIIQGGDVCVVKLQDGQSYKAAMNSNQK